jgi:hypothetical protein
MPRLRRGRLTGRARSADPVTTQSGTTTWALAGTLLISCNCDFGCPCNFNARPSRGDCDGQWLWHVEHGHVGGVSLDGLSFTVTADWPAAIHEGGGRAICLYDDRADDAQRAAIDDLVFGRLGGPWGVFINTYALEPPKAVPFEVHIDGLSTTATAGTSMRLEFDTIRNPVSGAEVHPRAVLPEGLVATELAFGMSKTFVVDDSIAWDHSGQYTAICPFSYSG